MTMSAFDFYTSDLHFSHERIIEFGRPFENIQKHNEFIIRAWNSRVGIFDKVLLLGDVAFNSGLAHVSRLNGEITLILGNHDNKRIGVYNNLFEDVKAYHELKGLKVLFSHIPVHESQLDRWNYNVHGHTHFEKIKDERYINICLEHTNYAPLSHEELLLKLKKE